jgi:hypothetical protein
MLTYIIDTMPLIYVCKFIVNNMFTLILQMVRPEILKINSLINSNYRQYRQRTTYEKCEISSHMHTFKITPETKKQ